MEGPSGGEIEIPVSLGDYDELHLVFGDEEDVNFEVSATIGDGTGDGGVDVTLDTDAGESGAAWLVAANGSDSVSVTDVANPHDVGTLDPASYDVALYETADESAALDTATVSINTSQD